MSRAKMAALRLDQQRISLQRQHKSFLVDLAKSSVQPRCAEFSERIEGLRLMLKQSMIESIDVSRMLIKRMDKLNFGGMADASIALGRLRKTCSDVTETLNRLDKRAAR